MSQVISPSVKRPYGLALIAHCWKVPPGDALSLARCLDVGQKLPRTAGGHARASGMTASLLPRPWSLPART